MIEQTVTILTTLITRSHPCQQDLGDEDEQDVEGSSEYDWVVIDTALDVVIGMALAMGTAFGELWKVFEKAVMKFASSQENLERSTAVGVIAECAAHMGAAVSPYTAAILKLLLKRLTDPDPETKSNAAYAVGQLIYNSTDINTYLPSYTDILTKLEPMLSIDHARIKDNATGCVCRMIISHPDRVPIADVLPVLVGLLPLKEDFEENAPVYECLYKLCKSSRPNLHLCRLVLTKLVFRRSQRAHRPESHPQAHRRVREGTLPSGGPADRRVAPDCTAHRAEPFQGQAGPISRSRAGAEACWSRLSVGLEVVV